MENVRKILLNMRGANENKVNRILYITIPIILTLKYPYFILDLYC